MRNKTKEKTKQTQRAHERAYIERDEKASKTRLTVCLRHRDK